MEHHHLPRRIFLPTCTHVHIRNHADQAILPPTKKKTKLTFPQEKRQLLISEKDGALHTVFTDRMICTVYSGLVHLHPLLPSLKSPLNHHPCPHHVHLQKKTIIANINTVIRAALKDCFFCTRIFPK